MYGFHGSIQIGNLSSFQAPQRRFLGITNSSSSWKNGNVIQGEVSGGPRILKPFGIVKNIVYITKKGGCESEAKSGSTAAGWVMISQSRFHLKISRLVPTTKHKPALSHSFQQNFGLVASGHPQQWSCFSSSFVSSMSTSSCGQALRASFPGGNFIMRGRSMKWQPWWMRHLFISAENWRHYSKLFVQFLKNEQHIYIYVDIYIDIWYLQKKRFTHSHTFKKTYGPMCSEHILYFHSQAPPNCAN